MFAIFIQTLKDDFEKAYYRYLLAQCGHGKQRGAVIMVTFPIPTTYVNNISTAIVPRDI